MAFELIIQKKHFLIPEAGDPCDMWTTYFTTLKKTIGAKNAKMIWLVTWSTNGSTSCTTNAEFNQFLKRNDIDVSSAGTRAVADLSAIGGNVLGAGKNLTKMASIAIPIAGGIALLFVLMKLFKGLNLSIPPLSTPSTA